METDDLLLAAAGTGGGAVGVALNSSIFSTHVLAGCAGMAVAGSVFAFGVGVARRYRKSRGEQWRRATEGDVVPALVRRSARVSEEARPGHVPEPATTRPVPAVRGESPRRAWHAVLGLPLVFECSECDVRFSSAFELRRHIVNGSHVADVEEAAILISERLRKPAVVWASDICFQSSN
jgi:hypothetical protein